MARALRWSRLNWNVFAAVAVRALWWTALGLLATTGPGFLAGQAEGPDASGATVPFGIAFCLSLPVLALAPRRYLRAGAMGTASLAGVGLLLCWTAMS